MMKTLVAPKSAAELLSEAHNTAEHLLVEHANCDAVCRCENAHECWNRLELTMNAAVEAANQAGYRRGCDDVMHLDQQTTDETCEQAAFRRGAREALIRVRQEWAYECECEKEGRPRHYPSHCYGAVKDTVDEVAAEYADPEPEGKP